MKQFSVINKKVVLLLWCILICISSTLMAAEYHVSKAGADGNDGSKSSPFKTISAAAGKAEPGDVVTVHEGIYREQVNPPRGGTSDDKRIIYRAADGEKVVVKGSEVVKGWKKVENDTWEVVLPNTFFVEFNPFNDLISGDWFRNNPGASNHTGAVYLNNKQLTETFSLDKVLRPFGAAAGNSMQYLINISKIKVSKSDKPVAADSFTSQSGIQTAPCTEGGKCIGWIEDGDWAVYEVDFGKNADKVEFRTASLSRNALIELRLDSHEGELLGRCMVTPTGDWQVWKSVTAKIKPVSGVKKLCLVFKDPTTTETNAVWFAKVDDKNTTVWAQFKGFDPNKEMVEINVRKTIFYPEKTGINYITVSGFVMEHAATPWAPSTAEQIGIIGTNWSKGWVLENNNVRHSVCSGILLWPDEMLKTNVDMQVIDNKNGYITSVSRPKLIPFFPEPGKRNGTSVIICPGGGYGMLAWYDHVERLVPLLNARGITVFGLMYRTSPPSRNVPDDATEDFRRAIRIVNANASQWGISPERLVGLGFSAGSNLLLNYACTEDVALNRDDLHRGEVRLQNMALLCLWANGKTAQAYSIQSDAPNAILFAAEADKIAPVEFSRAIAEKLKKAGKDVEVKVYPKGDHLAFNITEEGPAIDWTANFFAWLVDRGLEGSKTCKTNNVKVSATK